MTPIDWHGPEGPGNVQVGARGNTVAIKYGNGVILMPLSRWLYFLEGIRDGDFDTIGDHRHSIPNPRTTS